MYFMIVVKANTENMFIVKTDDVRDAMRLADVEAGDVDIWTLSTSDFFCLTTNGKVLIAR